MIIMNRNRKRNESQTLISGNVVSEERLKIKHNENNVANEAKFSSSFVDFDAPRAYMTLDAGPLCRS